MTRRRRKNADSNIRKLERASSSGEYEDIARYWYALLKAGQMPKPLYDYESLDAREGHSYVMPWVAWTILDEDGDRLWQVNIEMQPAVGPTEYRVVLFDSHNRTGSASRTGTLSSRKAALQVAAQLVKEMLEKYDDPETRTRGWL